jgi:type IV pilus assembly protein PilA
MFKKIQKGFTLIELMIVVAIIGLLAALAIPNFIKFQAKARQSEAKSNLKAAFTAEKAYYGDKQTYYDIFSVIGFEPEMNNRYAYFGQNGVGDNTGEVRTAGSVVHHNIASLSCATGPQGDPVISVDEQKWTANADPAYASTNAVPVGAAPNTGSGVAAGITILGVTNGAAGTCCAQGQCEFAVGAVGNIDNDTTLDNWFIASQGSLAGGGNASCGAGKTGDYAEGEPVNPCNDVNN